MSGIEKGINAFFAGLITIALFTVLFSKKSQTPQVLTSAGQAVGTSLFAAQGIK